MFDEPTSSLTETEVEHLFRIINMLRSRGCGIIYISHKMEEILRISDDVTIMRDGQWVATRPAAELTMDEIIRLLPGHDAEEVLQHLGAPGAVQAGDAQDLPFPQLEGRLLGATPPWGA